MNLQISHSGEYAPYVDYSTSAIGMGKWDTTAEPTSSASLNWRTTVVTVIPHTLKRQESDEPNVSRLLDEVLATYADAWKTLAEL
jgi:hypothetical protein